VARSANLHRLPPFGNIEWMTFCKRL
jgi:hypothetical protein